MNNNDCLQEDGWCKGEIKQKMTPKHERLFLLDFTWKYV